MMLREALEIAGASDTGRVREHNEDSFASDPDCGLVVLADGMGGYRAGEVASAMAVTTVFQTTRDGLGGLVPGQTDRETGLHYESLVVAEAIERANREVYEAAREIAEYNGMGTTIVVALFYNNRVTVAHVGDSRLYRLRDDKLERITVDHTILQEFVDSGMYSEEEARASLNRNLITRALGVEPDVKIDLRESDAQPEDIYLLCSDGLTDMVPDARIERILQKERDTLPRAADKLIRFANRQGGADNISVLLVKVTSAFEANPSWQANLVDWFTP